MFDFGHGELKLSLRHNFFTSLAFNWPKIIKQPNEIKLLHARTHAHTHTHTHTGFFAKSCCNITLKYKVCPRSSYILWGWGWCRSHAPPYNWHWVKYSSIQVGKTLTPQSRWRQAHVRQRAQPRWVQTSHSGGSLLIGDRQQFQVFSPRHSWTNLHP